MLELNDNVLASPRENAIQPELDSSYWDSLNPHTPENLLPPIVVEPRVFNTKKININGDTLSQSRSLDVTSTWLNRLADSYINSAYRNLDLVHDPILLKLLSESYSAANVLNDPNRRAYEVLRGTTPQGSLGMPLYIVTNQNTINAIPTQTVNDWLRGRYPNINFSQAKVVNPFFIRDFLQIYSTGNLSLSYLVIEDNIPFSDFARKFNDWVTQVNQHLPLAAVSERVREFNQLAHRDAIQLIPAKVGELDRLSGVLMRNVTVSYNLINAKGSSLQGIFASDGAFKELKIINNYVTTAGTHTITVNGLLSGQISGNRDTSGNLLPAHKIRCLPLRIGGGANVYVLSFKNSVPANHAYYYEYAPISGLAPESDLRRTKAGVTNRTASFYQQVDMVKYQALVRTEVLAGRKPDYQALMQQLVAMGAAIPA